MAHSDPDRYTPVRHIWIRIEQFFLRYASDWKQNAMGVVASLEGDADLLWDRLEHAYESEKMIITPFFGGSTSIIIQIWPRGSPNRSKTGTILTIDCGVTL